MKWGTTGVRLKSRVSKVSVITRPMINVINHFQCHQVLHTSNIQFIKTSCIYLGTLFLKLWRILNFKQCDQFQERNFVWLGWGHHDMYLPRAPEGDKTALCGWVSYHRECICTQKSKLQSQCVFFKHLVSR